MKIENTDLNMEESHDSSDPALKIAMDRLDRMLKSCTDAALEDLLHSALNTLIKGELDRIIASATPGEGSRIDDALAMLELKANTLMAAIVCFKSRMTASEFKDNAARMLFESIGRSSKTYMITPGNTDVESHVKH